MAWLVGIICVILIIAFWRVFLPLALIAGVAFAIFIVSSQEKQENRRKAKQAAEDALRTKIAVAQQNATSEGKEWQVYYQPDPASQIPIARYASVRSDDDLCYLSVQKRINGTELTELSCSEIPINWYRSLEIKFDSIEVSQEMELKQYSDSTGGYISSYQPSYRLEYDRFIDLLQSANSLAVKVPATEMFWTRFNLQGAAHAIEQLGKPQSSAQ